MSKKGDKVYNAGRKMSYLLRHDKEDLTMDKKGWVPVEEMLPKLDITLEDLEHIVTNNNKQRFEFDEEKKNIRARQGHSLKVDVELKKTIPPFELWHGSAEKNVDSILKNGREKRNRLHCHLSEDEATAIQVGTRHGKPHLLKIKARAMNTDGFVFYLSNNGVWLTDHVPAKYIEDGE